MPPLHSSWGFMARSLLGSWPICGPGVKGVVIVSHDRVTRSEIETPPFAGAAFRVNN